MIRRDTRFLVFFCIRSTVGWETVPLEPHTAPLEPPEVSGCHMIPSLGFLSDAILHANPPAEDL